MKDRNEINDMVQWYKNTNTYLDYHKIGLMSKATIYHDFIFIDKE